MSGDAQRDYLVAEIAGIKEDFERGAPADAHARLTRLAAFMSILTPQQLADPALARWGMGAAIFTGNVALAETLNEIGRSDRRYGRPLAISPAMPLQDWCAAAGVPARVIDPPRAVTLAATTPYSQSFAYTTDPVIYAAIPGGRWIGGWDFAIGSDRTVLIDTSYQPVSIPMAPYPHFYVAEFGRMMHYAPAKEIFISGDVLLLSAPHQLHFGHWLVDFLPRLRGLEVAKDPSLRVAVPADIPDKFREMLACWGIGEDRLLLGQRDTQYQFETLHVLKPGRYAPPHPDHVRLVREKLRGPGETDDLAAKRIFAARGRVGTREIGNWDEVWALLEAEGFIDVELTDLSITDQRALMAGAEIVLGVYGSNLFAFYFAPGGCNVIALMPEGMDDPTVAHTCAIFGMKHQFLWCPATNSGARNQLNDTQLTVDIDVLRQRLRELA